MVFSTSALFDGAVTGIAGLVWGAGLGAGTGAVFWTAGARVFGF